MTKSAGNDDRFLEDLRFILRGGKRDLAVLSVLSLLSAISETFLLAAIVQSISTLTQGTSDLHLSLGPLSLTASVQLVLFCAVVAAVVRGGFTSVVALTGPRIAAQSRQRMRQRLFGAYIAADWATQSADKTGRLLQTFSSSVNDANAIILMLTQALPAMITLTVLLTLAVILNPLVTVAFIVIGVGVGLGLRPLSRRANRAARDDAAARHATASHVTGVMAAGAEVAVLGARGGVVEVANARIGRAERSFARAQGYKRLVSMAGQSIAFLLASLGLWILSVGGWDVDFAVVGTIAVLLLRGAGLAQQVQSATSLYGAVIPFIQQVRSLIDHYDQQVQAYGEDAFPETFDVELQGVTYAYPGVETPALVVDDAIIREGEFVAILGPSGSGKSTLIQLVLRLRAPTQGSVRIGRVPAWRIREDAFSSRVAYVPQTPHLVPGTIMENIQFFREHVSEEAVVEAAKLAHIHEEIERLPLGYDTVLDSHVDALSGGQRQRLSLARALTTIPKILVLDEPTSALDTVNERAVIATLARLRGLTTVLMITHKQSTVADCDTVFVVERGRLRAPGHRETFGGDGVPAAAPRADRAGERPL